MFKKCWDVGGNLSINIFIDNQNIDSETYNTDRRDIKGSSTNIFLEIIKTKIMKNIIILLLTSLCLSTCDKNTVSTVTEADKKPTISNGRTRSAGMKEANALNVQAKADWQNFRKKSDIMVGKLDRNLTKFDSSYVKVNEMDIVYINYKDAKDDVSNLKDQLNSESKNFGQDTNGSNEVVVRNNKIFKENFTAEITQVNEDVNNLFDFNKQ